MNNERWKSFIDKLPIEFCDRGPVNTTGAKFDIGYDILPFKHVDYLNESNYILDLGCGTGQFLCYLKERNKKVLGVTYNENEVKEGIKRGLTEKEIVQGDVHDLSFIEDNIFDGVVMWEMIEHCLSPQIVLWETDRVCKLGAKGMIYLPHELYTDFSVHTILPTKPQMLAMLKKTNFAIDKIISFSGNSDIYFIRKVKL